MWLRRSSRARTDTQLPQATVELVHSRGPLAVRTAAGGGDRMGDGADRDRAARGPALSAPLSKRWKGCSTRSRPRRRRAAGERRWCAMNCCCLPNLASGSISTAARSPARNDDLVAVSPKSGRAVSAAEAEPYAGKLLPLPPFVREGGRASGRKLLEGLDLTGHFLVRDLLTDRSRPLAGARAARRAVAPRGWTRLGWQQ